jgi:hypothetical protein
VIRAHDAPDSLKQRTANGNKRPPRIHGPREIANRQG